MVKKVFGGGGVNLEFRKSKISELDEVIVFIKEFATFINGKEFARNNDESFTAVTNIDKVAMSNAIFIEKKVTHLFIEVNGEKVGYMVYYNLFSTFSGKLGIYLEDLYIRKEFRGLGIGKKAFEYLKGIGLKNNYCKIEWNCLKTNIPALKFYEEELKASDMNELTFFELNNFK